MKMLICGDRNWNDSALIGKVLDGYKPSVVIEGEATGADTLARREAKKRGIKVEPYPAQWMEYGKAAGPIRNRRMISEGKPDIVIAFHDFIKESKGTKHMMALARMACIDVELITHHEGA